MKYDPDKLRGEVDIAIHGERSWRQYFSTTDKGSYSEGASHEAIAAQKVLKAWKALANELLEFERSFDIS